MDRQEVEVGQLWVLTINLDRGRKLQVVRQILKLESEKITYRWWRSDGGSNTSTRLLTQFYEKVDGDTIRTISRPQAECLTHLWRF